MSFINGAGLSQYSQIPFARCKTSTTTSAFRRYTLVCVIAVIGFFVGGLISAHFLIPLIFGS